MYLLRMQCVSEDSPLLATSHSQSDKVSQVFWPDSIQLSPRLQDFVHFHFFEGGTNFELNSFKHQRYR